MAKPDFKKALEDRKKKKGDKGKSKPPWMKDDDDKDDDDKDDKDYDDKKGKKESVAERMKRLRSKSKK